MEILGRQLNGGFDAFYGGIESEITIDLDYKPLGYYYCLGIGRVILYKI